MPSLIAGVALACALAQQARAPERLNPSSGGATTGLAVDADGGLAAVAWVEIGASGHSTWIALSHDVARTWSVPVRLDGDASGAPKQLAPSSVDVRDGEIRVLWLDRRAGGRDNLWQRVSRDGGASWDAEARVPDGHAPGVAQVAQFSARGGAAGQVVIALLLQAMPAGDEIRVARSTDGGVSYSTGPALHAGGSARALDLELDGAAAHLAWTDDTSVAGLQSVRYLRSLDGGTSWPGPAIGVSGTINAIDGVLDLAAAGARVSVVFQDLFAIHAVGSNHSVDGGVTWLAVPLRVAGSRSPSITPAHPRLLLTPSDVLVAWTDDRAVPGQTTPWLAGTRDSGSTWSESALAPSFATSLTLAGDAADGTFASAWIGGSAVLVAGSRAAAPQPLPPFVAGASAGNLSSLAQAYDAAYAHHLLAWLDFSTGVAQPWVGGCRIPFASPVGTGAAGSPMAFRLERARAADAGRGFRALLAHDVGAATLPFGDGRALGLAPGAWLTASASAAALAGTLGADGSGITGSALIPPGLPPGTRVHYVCAVFDAASRTFGDLTDAALFFTQ